MDIHVVNVFTLNAWLEAIQAIVLDVRESDEYVSGHIKGAINLPLSTALSGIDQIKGVDGKKIVLQCGIGRRSMKACQLLQEAGFKHDVWNLEGGMTAWMRAGYNAETK